MYASVLRMWVEERASRNKNPLAMTFDALREYEQVRLDEDGISTTTWNGNLPALRWFADTAVRLGLMQPMSDRDWKDLRRSGTSVRMPRVVDPDTYARFRRVGLQGLTPDGHLSHAFHALKTPIRDALFADFLLIHGTRRAEACYLTLLDLPRRRAGYAFNVGYLPPAICKWGSGRDLEEQVHWVQRLAAYHDSEWLTTIAEAQKSLRRARDRGRLLVVTDVHDRFGRNTRLTIDGISSRRSLVNLTKEQRRRLVCTGQVARRIGNESGMGRGMTQVQDAWVIPLAIFPGTRAPMLTPEAWGLTFREANDRVDALLRSGHADVPDAERVTPHMLRHTFATQWLAHELERIAESDRDFAQVLATGDAAQLRRRYFNPLLRVKALLGHRSLETTLLYIDHIMREQQAANMSGDSWIESFLEAN
ncbi:hypothetical protein [Modestobacter sp. SSW1-42]|uniref:hypothetical protein n=1 Tax=Modestobacter sp. SSW1-42 TaxID=596372 RepID=UPI003988072C